jgi:hypothetical protein
MTVTTLTDLLRRPTLAQTVAAELAQAEREKLQAETAREFAESIVRYNELRIRRLKAYLNEITTHKNTN